MERAVADLEERLSSEKAALRKLLEETLPDMLAEAGIDGLEVAARGNQPAFKVKLAANVFAGIAASWPEERRQAALDYLQDSGASDLIKTTVSVAFGRDHRAAAVKLIRELKDRGLEPGVQESVHAGTLSAWLRDAVKSGKRVDLDSVGGYVGRKVTMREAKE